MDEQKPGKKMKQEKEPEAQPGRSDSGVIPRPGKRAEMMMEKQIQALKMQQRLEDAFTLVMDEQEVEKKANQEQDKPIEEIVAEPGRSDFSAMSRNPDKWSQIMIDRQIKALKLQPFEGALSFTMNEQEVEKEDQNEVVKEVEQEAAPEATQEAAQEAPQEGAQEAIHEAIQEILYQPIEELEAEPGQPDFGAIRREANRQPRAVRERHKALQKRIDTILSVSLTPKAQMKLDDFKIRHPEMGASAEIVIYETYECEQHGNYPMSETQVMNILESVQMLSDYRPQLVNREDDVQDALDEII